MRIQKKKRKEIRKVPIDEKESFDDRLLCISIPPLYNNVLFNMNNIEVKKKRNVREKNRVSLMPVE